MSIRVIIPVAAVAFLTLAAGSVQAQERSDDRSFMEKFGLIVQRNIFARNRAQTSQRPSTRSDPPPKPAAFHILTGIVRREDGDGYLAFIEDTRAGTTNKVLVGSTIAQGTVKRIDFGAIEFETDGRLVTVEIGKSLVGSSSVPQASTTQPSSESGSADSSARTGSGSSVPSGDVAERMRQRRLQELKK
ncbi:MAG: hypothetical protein ACM359_11895 [Bacillota bacterium]